MVHRVLAPIEMRPKVSIGDHVCQRDLSADGDIGGNPADVKLTLLHLPTQVLRWNGTVCLGHFHVSAVRDWLKRVNVKTLFIEPGSPWEKGYVESFNGRLRDELVNGKIFYSLKEAKILIEQCRRHYNTKRPHSSLAYRPPAPETMTPVIPVGASLWLRSARRGGQS